MTKPNLTAKRLREALTYDLETGVFNWKLPGPRIRVGGIAGGSMATGHQRICIDGKRLLAHRLAWLYIHDSWPTHDIDHLDGNPENNAISNLRDVSTAENIQNQRKAHRASKSKFLGVIEYPGRKKPWMAQIQIAGRSKYLGYFSTPELAHAAYVAAKRIHHPGCTI